ncbi:MAG TPA: hypothetical protein PLV65_00370 [Tenuifilaceae bacterium]|nr:hypothetical protein [Tenuifilaceae bacterium]
MKTLLFTHQFYALSNAGLVISYIQHRFSFLCSSQKGSTCSMRGQRSW